MEGDDESGSPPSSGSEEAVRVFVRIRPLNKREIAEKQTVGKKQIHLIFRFRFIKQFIRMELQRHQYVGRHD